MDRKGVWQQKNFFRVRRYIDLSVRPLASQCGLSLSETIVASALGIFLVGLVVSTTYMTTVAKKDFGARMDLTNKARTMLDRMSYGYQQTGQANRRGISEAVSATLPASTQIDYTDVNAVVHSIRLNTTNGNASFGNIEYRRGAAGSWQSLMDLNGSGVAYNSSKDLANLTFSKTLPNSVLVKLVIGRQIKGRWQYASASTEIAFRNAS